ncbi:unnamed protein product [Dicrocoelium dendriticum]|nr:unnamed protein product [Dicrocoelium dendriticum]
MIEEEFISCRDSKVWKPLFKLGDCSADYLKLCSVDYRLLRNPFSTKHEEIDSDEEQKLWKCLGVFRPCTDEAFDDQEKETEVRFTSSVFSFYDVFIVLPLTHSHPFLNSDDAWVDIKKMPEYPQLMRDSISKKTYGKYSLEGYLDEKKFKVDEKELALLRRLLTMDPVRRPSAAEAMEDQYFKEGEPPNEDVFGNVPNPYPKREFISDEDTEDKHTGAAAGTDKIQGQPNHPQPGVRQGANTGAQHTAMHHSGLHQAQRGGGSGPPPPQHQQQQQPPPQQQQQQPQQQSQPGQSTQPHHMQGNPLHGGSTGVHMRPMHPHQQGDDMSGSKRMRLGPGEPPPKVVAPSGSDLGTVSGVPKHHSEGHSQHMQQNMASYPHQVVRSSSHINRISSHQICEIFDALLTDLFVIC